MDDLLYLVLSIVLGACVGSFLNVVIHRLPRGGSVLSPARSYCPSCRQAIPAHLNVPIVSWLLLRGRCAKCKSAIAPRYLLVEAATALLFALVTYVEMGREGEPSLLRLGFDYVAIALGVAITVIDFEWARIPDSLDIPWLPFFVAGVALEPELLRGRWLDVAAGGDGPVVLALALAGVAIGAYPALFVDFLRSEADLGDDGEPVSLLPQPDEEFSLLAETREFLKPLLLPAAAGAVASVLLLRGVDLAASPKLSAAIAATAGAGAGLLGIYAIRFVFSAMFRKEAMGLGDAKFLALAGVLLGAEGAGMVFAMACFLGAVPALFQLVAKLPLATAGLILATATPILLLPHIDARDTTQFALGMMLGFGVPMIALLFYFRRIRRGDIELSAMPFGPFLALATVVLLVGYPRIVAFLRDRLHFDS